MTVASSGTTTDLLADVLPRTRAGLGRLEGQHQSRPIIATSRMIPAISNSRMLAPVKERAQSLDIVDLGRLHPRCHRGCPAGCRQRCKRPTRQQQIQPNSTAATAKPSGALRLNPARIAAKSMSSIITTNRNSTATAPT